MKDLRLWYSFSSGAYVLRDMRMNSSAYRPKVLVFQVNVTQFPIYLTDEILFAKTFRFSRIVNLGSIIFCKRYFLTLDETFVCWNMPKKNIYKKIANREETKKNLNQFLLKLIYNGDD